MGQLNGSDVKIAGSLVNRGFPFVVSAVFGCYIIVTNGTIFIHIISNLYDRYKEIKTIQRWM